MARRVTLGSMADRTLTERYRAARSDPELAVLEGLHALKHALRFDAEVLDVRGRDLVELRSLAESLAPDVADAILDRAEAVEPDAFESLAPSPHPTGVIALARRRVADPVDLLGREGSGAHGGDARAAAAPVVLLERATHHGNIGAVIRVAAAAGAAGVLVTGPHDPWHPASIRGAAGLQYALPVASLEPAGLEPVLATARPVVALDPEGGRLVGAGGSRPTPIPPRSVLAFGSERTGVSAALLERADLRVAIPMRPGVSSLNLATAVAVTLYAAGGWAAFGS